MRSSPRSSIFRAHTVLQGQVLLVIEAMKMETAIAAPTAGTVKAIHAAAGDTVRENQVLVHFDDPAST